MNSLKILINSTKVFCDPGTTKQAIKSTIGKVKKYNPPKSPMFVIKALILLIFDFRIDSRISFIKYTNMPICTKASIQPTQLLYRWLKFASFWNIFPIIKIKNLTIPIKNAIGKNISNSLIQSNVIVQPAAKKMNKQQIKY